MKGSFKIAQFFGIPVLLHWSFALLFLAGLYYIHENELSWQETKWWALLTICVFGCILLHEYGHALVARKFGVKTKDIILLPFGGMARLNKLPDKPLHEFLVALAGPLANIMIAVLLFPFFWLFIKPELNFHPFSSPENIDDDFFLFLPLIIFINILLAIFNLIPAFPMDGGRMLRGLLSFVTNRVNATKIAVIVGVVIAFLLSVYGIMTNKWLYVLISLFIVNTATKEYRWVKTESVLKSFFVENVYDKNIGFVHLNQGISEVIKVYNNTGEKRFFVKNEMDKTIGILNIDILDIEEENPTGLVKDFYMSKVVETSLNDDLKKANELMQINEVELLAVCQEGKWLGVLHENALWEFIDSSLNDKGNAIVK